MTVRVDRDSRTDETVVSGPCCECEKPLEVRVDTESVLAQELTQRGLQNLLLCDTCKRRIEADAPICGMKLCTDPEHQPKRPTLPPMIMGGPYR